jgi:hypothetical protein
MEILIYVYVENRKCPLIRKNFKNFEEIIQWVFNWLYRKNLYPHGSGLEINYER